LYKAGKIGYEDALNSADSRNEVRLMIKLSSDNATAFENDEMLLSETDENKGVFDNVIKRPG
jgi:twitching motility protein PilU